MNKVELRKQATKSKAASSNVIGLFLAPVWVEPHNPCCAYLQMFSFGRCTYWNFDYLSGTWRLRSGCWWCGLSITPLLRRFTSVPMLILNQKAAFDDDDDDDDDDDVFGHIN